MLAKRMFNTAKSDDKYEHDVSSESRVPSLLPVFDPAFTATTASPITFVDPGLEHIAAASFTQTQTRLSSFDNSTNFHNDPEPSSIELPDIGGDLEAIDFREWHSWVASRRVAAIRRWIIYAAHKYGPVDRWGEDFSQEWGTMRHKDALTVCHWLDSVKQRVKIGRTALNYLERAMEGELSASVEEWRDLYVQSHELAAQLWGGVLGVQTRLDRAISELGFIQAH